VIEQIANSDPEFVKTHVSLGSGAVVKVGAFFFLFMIAGAVYTYWQNPYSFQGSTLIVAVIFSIIMLGAIFLIAYPRRTLRGRLETGNFTDALEMRYEPGKLLFFGVGFSSRWEPGIFNNSNINKIEFISYGQDRYILVVSHRTSGRRGGVPKRARMVFEKAEKERLTRLLFTFGNIKHFGSADGGASFWF